MAIIQLISDFQSGSYKIGLLHSQLLNTLKGVDIIDISHDLRLQNIVEASFVLKQLQNPENQGMVSIVRIGSNFRSIIYQHKNNWYIFPDNGLISLVFELNKNDVFYTFENEHLADVVKRLLQNDLGKLTKINDIVLKTQKKPMVHEHMVVCERIFTDPHGNCYFNLTKDLFEENFEKGRFNAKIQYIRDANFYEIYQDYNDVDQGVALLMFSKTGFLKLAINQGNASQLFRIKEDTKITIQKI